MFYGAFYSPAFYADPGFFYGPALYADAGFGLQVSEPSPAYLEVVLPDPDGALWLNGNKTTVTGAERLFVSPPLEQGKRYSYTVTAVWNQNGQIIKEERKVYVAPGRTSVADFTEQRQP